MWDHMDGSWWIGGMIMMVLFWGAVILFAAWAVQSLSRREPPRDESALGIARRRYAAGEITREQYEQIARDLAGPHGNPV